MSKSSSTRAVSCGLAVGLLFAAVAGVGVSGSAAVAGTDGREAGLPEATPGVQPAVSPLSALVGFLAGAPVGAAIGFLWARSGTSGVVGMLLVALTGGVAGLVAAGLLGAETQVVVTGTSIDMEHGSPPGVLIGGTVLGMIAGAACAWSSRPRPGDEPPCENSA